MRWPAGCTNGPMRVLDPVGSLAAFGAPRRETASGSQEIDLPDKGGRRGLDRIVTLVPCGAAEWRLGGALFPG